MKVKTFSGSSLPEAIMKAKQEFGNNIILPILAEIGKANSGIDFQNALEIRVMAFRFHFKNPVLYEQSLKSSDHESKIRFVFVSERL